MDNMDTIFKRKTLIISDFIAPFHVVDVYHHFDYYNIATLKNVKYYDHLEEEYNCENKPFYGFCIIEIDKWHNNNSAKNFYNAISENKGKIVYDDPRYWDVEFYSNNEQDENYVFQEEDEIKEDLNNNLYDNFYKKYDNSQKNLKRKYSSIIENLKAENKDLRELLIKKQKNYKKNNKTKTNKISYYRTSKKSSYK